MRHRRTAPWPGLVAAVTLAGLMLLPVDASAWLTSLWPDDEEGWRSMYCVSMVPRGEVGTACQLTGSAHTGDGRLLGNEHAEITDDTLHAIDPALAARFGARSCDGGDAAENCPSVVDLNASLLRHNVLERTSTVGRPGTALEERRLPPLVMWAGLPDFSYTVYDWINKNVICPALPPGADRVDLCHAYTAWLGAALNSTHFGEPAVRVYARHHAIAMRQAERARALRERLETTSGLPDGRTWHADAIEEAERLALIYETVGQHFLQDRWAIGHMISRWGTGDYDQLPVSPGHRHPRLDDVSLFGVLTGILHGSQEVFGHPDPLNTPYLGADPVAVMTWRYPNDDPRLPSAPTRFEGIGDGVFADLLAGVYRGNAVEQPDAPVSLTSARQQQGTRMRRCLAGGYRQVIAALGENPDATFGQLQLALPEPDPFLERDDAPRLGFDPAADPTCTELWATNDAVDIGIDTIAGQSTDIGDVVVVFEAWATGQDMAYTPPATRITVPLKLARAHALRDRKRDEAYRVQANGLVDYDLDNARGGMRFVAHGFTWFPNKHHAGIPGYYEPEDLDELPDELDNQHGRDKAALYGFFNQGSAHWWCDGLGARLDTLRDEISAVGRETETRQRLTAACAYLASRRHRRTDPAYPDAGARVEVIGEHLPLDSPDAPRHGDTFEPICAWFEDEDDTVRVTEATDDSNPYLLHPGYVETPGAPGELGYATQSLENWCARIPVVDTRVSATGAADTAFEIDHHSTRWMELTGHNFGLRTPAGRFGEVQAQRTDGSWVALDVYDEATDAEQGGWSDDGELIYARLPPAGAGFPSAATPDMLPHEIRAAAPVRYPLRLLRAEDLAALADTSLLADGASSAGPILVEVSPQITEIGPGWLLENVEITGTWVTWPVGLRADAEILASGWYRVENGVYTPLGVAFEFLEDQMAEGSDDQFLLQPYEGRAAIVVHNPDPQIFDGNVSFIFAFH